MEEKEAGKRERGEGRTEGKKAGKGKVGGGRCIPKVVLLLLLFLCGLDEEEEAGAGRRGEECVRNQEFYCILHPHGACI